MKLLLDTSVFLCYVAGSTQLPRDVARAIHLAHAAFTDLGGDRVGTERSAWFSRHH
ncbi:MAG: hypothetical protein QF681_13160 [Vicinamibacterales bacterium]|nr:hypothetical protein [Vicinamibacterales bacterium]